MSSDVRGTIDYMLIDNLVTERGPALSLLDLTTGVTISNFHYRFNKTDAQPLLCMLWSSIIVFENVTIEIPVSVGLFYIQYQSNITMRNFTISDFFFNYVELGCIFAVVSNSSLVANLFQFTNVKAFGSLIHVDNSVCKLTDLRMSNILIDGGFALTSQLATLTLTQLSLFTFSGGLLSSDQSWLYLNKMAVAGNNGSSVIGSNPILSFSKINSLIIQNSDFENITTNSNGGVHK